MKTLTEFFGRSIKTVEEQMAAWNEELTRQLTETWTTEGKSAEEIAAGLTEGLKTALQGKIGETQKIEGEKLSWFMSAMQMVKGKKGNLKRVVVLQMNEGEKAPHGAAEIDGKHFLIEFFPEPARAAGKGKFARDGKEGGREGRGGRGDKKGKGRGKRNAKGRGPRGEAGADQTVGGGEKKFTRRPPRKPRQDLPPEPPYVGVNRITPKGAPLAVTPAATAAVAENTPTT